MNQQRTRHSIWLTAQSYKLRSVDATGLRRRCTLIDDVGMLRSTVLALRQRDLLCLHCAPLALAEASRHKGGAILEQGVSGWAVSGQWAGHVLIQNRGGFIRPNPIRVREAAQEAAQIQAPQSPRIRCRSEEHMGRLELPLL